MAVVTLDGAVQSMEEVRSTSKLARVGGKEKLTIKWSWRFEEASQRLTSGHLLSFLFLPPWRQPCVSLVYLVNMSKV